MIDICSASYVRTMLAVENTVVCYIISEDYTTVVFEPYDDEKMILKTLIHARQFILMSASFFITQLRVFTRLFAHSMRTIMMREAEWNWKSSFPHSR